METKTRVVQRRRFTVEEYHKMAEAGILHEDDRVELIEGDVVEMTPIGSRHMRCVNELNWLSSRGLGDEVRVSVQNPLPNDAIERHNEPFGDGYRRTERPQRGETLVSEALPGLTVPVDGVLGPP